jgi:hypothetical protein
MSDRERDDGPETDPADRRVRRLRAKAMDLLADARIHVQRIEEIGEHLGWTPDLVDGVGDHLYHAVVAQLDFAAKVVERSHFAAERFLQLRASRRGRDSFNRIDIRHPDDRVSFDFTVRNGSIRSTRVDVKVEFVPHWAVSVTVGARHLRAGQQTSVEITIAGSKADEGHGDRKVRLEPGVHPGEVRVVLENPDGHRVELRRRYFEVWVHKS